MTSCAGSEPPLNHRDLMAIAGGRQPGVASPAVGVNFRPRLHGFLQEGQQALGGHASLTRRRRMRPMPRPRCSAATATMALTFHLYRPALPSSGPPDIGFVRPRSRRQGGRGRAAPWPAAACAARSRRSRSCRRPRARRSPRALIPFFWLVTNQIAREPCPQRLCGSLRISCRRLSRSPCGMPGTAASHRPFPTARRQPHSLGSKNRSASGAGGYRRGKQPHPETIRPVPGRCLGSQRPPPDA